MDMKLFDGYTKSGKRIEAKLVDNRVYIHYTQSGRNARFNQEYYTDDDYAAIKLMLLDAGFRI